MLNAAFTSQFVLSCLIGLLVWAAVSDFQSFIIPNRVSFGVLLLYPAHVLAYPAAVHWQFALVMGVIVFLIGCVFFAMKAMGGGDVKLLAVTAMWAGPEYFLEFFVVMGVSGLLLAIFFAARTAMVESATVGQRSLLTMVSDLRHVPIMKLTIPYGVAVAAAGMFTALRLLGL